MGAAVGGGGAVTRILRLGRCVLLHYPHHRGVRVIEGAYVGPARIATTIFPDGRELHAAPEDNDAYRAMAARLGYGDDTTSLSYEHELLHNLLAALAREPWSPALRAAVLGQGSSDDIWEEEGLVLRAQGLLHGREVMGPAQWRGVRLGELLGEARRLV
jgi:hypothetical protein